MGQRARRVTATIVASALAWGAPAAFAQSGDEQYSDPFEDAPAKTTSSPKSSSGSGSSQSPAPSTAPVPAAPAPQAAPGAAAGLDELPRTGADLRPAAVAGLLMLGFGLLLLRRSSAARR
ncbi:MAG: LPXTG cell wall anchor domain-containing protein [Baekduia sp.]